MQHLLCSLCLSLLALGPALAQGVTCFEGPSFDQLRVVTYPADASTPMVTLSGLRKIRPITPQGLLANAQYEFDRVQPATVAELPCLAVPGGARLFAYERLDRSGHGLLWVEPSGVARDVFEGQAQIDHPVAIASDRQHLAFADDRDLVVVRLDGAQFASTGNFWRRVAMPEQIVGGSVVVGPTHAFLVTDDDRIWRCGLADGAAAVDITPVVGSEQGEELCLSGDGRTVAFLRGDGSGLATVHVATGQGPARSLALPPRAYRQPNFLPLGQGQAGLLLNDDGSRLMVVEAGFEDEVHCIDTAAAAQPWHVTDDSNFALYIGAHILPKFRGRDLLLASGHAGWADWYLARSQGDVRNVTQTGSPEPPYFVGSLDVQARLPLQQGLELSVERLGNRWPLRRLDPTNESSLLTVVGNGPPVPGVSLSGTPDLLVPGDRGTLWVSGAHGGLRGTVPTGLRVSPPLHASPAYAATLIALDGVAVAVPALLLADGGLVLGPLLVGTAQLALLPDARLVVLQAGGLQVFGPQAAAVRPLPPQPFRVMVSGAVAAPE